MSGTTPAPVTHVARRYLDMKEEKLYLDTRLENLCRPIQAGYSDVHRAHFEGRPGDAVCVKHPKYTMDNATLNGLMDTALEKEITVLKRVRHSNILPFIGLVRHHGDPCIVTPWMKNGSLRRYLKTRPDADRLEILRDVAIAVEYLHSGAELPGTSHVIHGDIHAGNVLISDEGKALLADFGLSKLVPLNEQTSLSMRPFDKAQGVPCYMAPELHASNALRSLCSDVFAYGMLIYETYAGGPPKVPVDELLSGQRPERVSISRNDMTDAVWQVACDCWAHSPLDRPYMREVIARLREAPMPVPDLVPAACLATTVSTCDVAPPKQLEGQCCDATDPGLYLREKINIPFRPVKLANASEVYRAHYMGRPNNVLAVRRMRYEVTDAGEIPLTGTASENQVGSRNTVQEPGVHDHCMICAQTGGICECRSEPRPSRKRVGLAGLVPWRIWRIGVEMPALGNDGLPGLFHKGLSFLHLPREILYSHVEGKSDPKPHRVLTHDLTPFITIGRDRPFAISPCSDLYNATLLQNVYVVARRIRFPDDETGNHTRLRNAAAVLVKAHHVNILSYIGTCEYKGSLCIVSPFAGGGDIRMHIASQPDCDRRALLMQVAQGLLYLHQSCIVHGSLHPRNVLLCEDGNVKVSDFGLADIIPDEGTTSMRPAFAREKAMHRAPETHMGHALSPSSDVYSFGMLVFHAYSDKEPMVERYPGAIQVAAALMSGKRPLRGEISRLDFSENLWDVVQRGWMVEKEKRMSMSDVVVALGKATSIVL